MNYELQDGGKREEFNSGAVREPEGEKPRYDLIPPLPLQRLAVNMTKGAKKYGDNNWTKGMPTSRMLSSAMRHLEQARMGMTDEDHLAAVVFNVFAIMHFEGTEWDDRTDWTINGKR
jgi:hypothetical protein